jgi:oxygen-dependent protoporphyrinogen oxidase
MSRRVVVVGAGMTGLVAAYRLTQGDDPWDVVVLEADDGVGGKVRSTTVGGLDLEGGPDSLLVRKTAAVDLVKELGMGEDLVPAAVAATQIWTRKGLLPFPSGPFGISTDPWELARWGGMSWAAKIRAGGDLVLPKGRADGDESLGDVLRRRIGSGATDALVAPLLGGLFAGDVDRLSVRATFPELAAWEREHRSLMRGARAMSAARRPASVSGAGQGAPPPPMFVRLRGGLRRITDRLAELLGPERVRTGTAVTELDVAGDGVVLIAGGDRIEADAVVLTSPAFVSADLLAPAASEAARLLREIPYASTAVGLLVYGPGTDEVLPASSGFVAPRGALPMNAATIVSKKWPDDRFEGRAVLRCFIGGTGTEEALDAPDDRILADTAAALRGIYPLPAEPEAAALVRWPRAMPQYEVGHPDRVDAIEAGLPPGVWVAGQAFRGAGLPDCVGQASNVAEQIRAAG